jgi:hypothetical protein
MITLKRNEHDSEADRIEDRLKYLVVAYKTVIDPEIDSSYIEESGNKVIQGANMESWFRQLESELSWQRSLSGDGCFIDPETGNIC